MHYINPFILVSGLLWFASIMMLNSKIIDPPRSLHRLILLQSFSVYRNQIKMEKNDSKKRHLKMLYGLVLLFTANFFIQIVIHFIILELL